MTTYYSTRVASTIPARDGIGLVSQSATFTVSPSALLAADTVQLFKVPAGAVVRDLKVGSVSPGLQSGNDSVFCVGDGNSPSRFVPSGTVLRVGGGLTNITDPSSLEYQYPAEDTIDLQFSTIGTGQTTGGKIYASIIYAKQK